MSDSTEIDMTQSKQPDNATVEPYLTMGDLSRILRRSIRTIRHWRAEGYLPKPDLVHGKTVLWRRETVNGWLHEQSLVAI